MGRHEHLSNVSSDKTHMQALHLSLDLAKSLPCEDFLTEKHILITGSQLEGPWKSHRMPMLILCHSVAHSRPKSRRTWRSKQQTQSLQRMSETAPKVITQVLKICACMRIRIQTHETEAGRLSLAIPASVTCQVPQNNLFTVTTPCTKPAMPVEMCCSTRRKQHW